jgi:hypothetical protein
VQTCHHNPSEDQINFTDITQQQLLELLLMFVAYCVNVLKKAPTSILGILSGLKNNLVLRFVPLEAFDNKPPRCYESRCQTLSILPSSAVAVHLWYGSVHHPTEHSTAR